MVVRDGDACDVCVRGVQGITMYRSGLTDQNRKKGKEIRMKYMLVGLLSLMLASTAFADGSVVSWHTIVGVITATGVDNPVADINSGASAWTTTSGQAAVDLKNGVAVFHVKGLVLNGTMFSGTPGPITQVIGTLVCNAGQAGETVNDTAPVSLSAQGNARFFGAIGSIATPCNNPLFLIRVAQPAGAFGRWIATGAVRSFGDDFSFGEE
jgi:hypothetical protein